MSQKILRVRAARLQACAAIFAALGQETRLSLVTKLSEGHPCSISQLTGGSKLTRQAVTRHLKVLEEVGLVRSTASGRESLFELDTRPFKDIGEYLEFVSEQWDQTLGRLKSFVEG
jgi:DNA-binding transcriptional ArsR family regulator